MPNHVINRRALLRAGILTGGLLTGVASASTAVFARTAQPANGTAPDQRPATPDQAWATLREGNRRWVDGTATHPHQDVDRRREVAQKQDPFAVVFSCIDSRVSPELIFDTGLGDLFVVRTAAQTIDPLVTGAAEYGPAELGTPLVVVLGHQRCGAVTAAAESLHEHKKLPGELDTIASALRSAYKRSGGDVDKMIRINTIDVVKQLKKDKLFVPRIAKGQLKVIGAYYSIDTGVVTRLV
ncbi:carbonic anhydrase [Nonomuraea angiospora]|uniref:Carbonic anhydrase n=1 Tax=Nonomuraea angiospora TaxID=46172 RepID=A0ABR9LYG0_9ACTN|nr:carbonic anhydrase [Nonomuraea angiospora]MBE1585372.1 carbonic anhydrase [Nonomuraea angiospora]